MNAPGRPGWTLAFTRLSTSQKLILVLTIALMPLGAVALLVSLQSARTADKQRRVDVEIAATEAARKLNAELASDIVALSQAANGLDLDPKGVGPCARLNAQLASNPMRHTPVALFGIGSWPVCTSNKITDQRPVVVLADFQPVFRRTGDVVDLVVPSRGGTSIAIARYSRAKLASFAKPSGFTLPYRMTLDIDGGNVDMEDPLDAHPLARTESATVPVGISTLSLTMSVAGAAIGVTEALLAFLPILMWAAALLVGYYVVDRFLVRPLKALRAAVANYEPGSARITLSETPATEIRELETSFTAFADRLAERERELEVALADQVKLTREVHHRVKNNLQVIASLINLHARGETAVGAQLAYAAIQRRVDALAIVHRNHYAELENSAGIDFKALIGELVANFRSNTGQSTAAPVVTVSSIAAMVGQDTAMPLAFLFTEVTEIALLSNPSTPISIHVQTAVLPTSACLEIRSASLRHRDVAKYEASLRIVDALGRQLRSTVKYDVDHGRYSVLFPVLSETTGR